MNSSPLVSLARQAVEQFVLQGSVYNPQVVLPSDLPARAACFVSLHGRDGSLRGCIGTITPLESDLAREVVRNAIAACTRDPRFAPVCANELADLVYSVDVLSESEPIDSASELDPRVYGVIVEQGWRRGLLLPDLPGVDEPQVQLHIALEKAGIPSGSAYRISRFRVRRYT